MSLRAFTKWFCSPAPCLFVISYVVDKDFNSEVDTIEKAVLGLYDNVKVTPAIIVCNTERFYGIRLVAICPCLYKDVEALIIRISGLLHVKSCTAQLPDYTLLHMSEGKLTDFTISVQTEAVS